MPSGAPRVLLGNLEPVVQLGMATVLGEEGVDVVGTEHRPPDLVRLAGRLLPDAVVLALSDGDSAELVERIRAASPSTTVILWARDEDAMEVFDPGASLPRRLRTTGTSELRMELVGANERVEE